MGTVLVVTLCVQIGVYTGLGLLLIVRRYKREISSRSPWLLALSHVGNAIQAATFLVQLLGTETQGRAVLLPQVFSHFLFYFPYVLRGYRLHFVFHSGLTESLSNHDYFLKHLKRSREVWSLWILTFLMIPVTAACCVFALISELTEIDLYLSENGLGVFAAIYIAVMFIEQIVLIVGAYALRHVDREYSMSRELLVICALWYLNLVCARFMTNPAAWGYEIICRNTVIMAISILFPLLQSYRHSDLRATLTLQSLYSLQVVLENQVPYDYFQQFLRTKAPTSHLSQFEADLELAGDTVLDLYCRCTIYRYSPDPRTAADILTDMRAVCDEVSILPMEDVRGIDVKETGCTADLLLPLEIALWNLLENHYFPLFQRSDLFATLCHFVEQSELRAGRVKTTSLAGSDSP